MNDAERAARIIASAQAAMQRAQPADAHLEAERARQLAALAARGVKLPEKGEENARQAENAGGQGQGQGGAGKREETPENGHAWTDEKLAAFVLPADKALQRITVARRLYLEVKRGRRGVRRRWWVRFDATRRSIGAFPAVPMAKAKKRADAMLEADARGERTRGERMKCVNVSEAFAAAFVAGFVRCAPAGYEADRDAEAALPWCAPWHWARPKEWHVTGRTAGEMGERWAKLCAAQILEALEGEK